MSAFCSFVSIFSTCILFGLNCEQNQWYFTAENIERGVIQTASKYASVDACTLSYHTIVLKVVDTSDEIPTLDATSSNKRFIGKTSFRDMLEALNLA